MASPDQPESPASDEPVSPGHDEHAMRIALDQAQNAWLVGEVPVGAVIMRAGQVIATGYNRPITTNDPTAHAEIVALRHAAQLLENYRLPDCELFVTLEPCAMCAMALMHARFKRVVFGAFDPKTGVAGSVIDLFANSQLNHHTTVSGGVLAEASAKLLRDFFAERRAQAKALRAAGEAVDEEADADAEADAEQAASAASLPDDEGVLHLIQPPPGADSAHTPIPPIPVGQVSEFDPDNLPPSDPSHHT